MIAIRSLLYLIGQIVSAIIIVVILVPFLPFPKLRQKIIVSWSQINIWTLKKLCGIDCRIQGKENIPTGASVVLSNHQSAWETLYFQLILPPISFVLKKQLLWLPFFGWGLAAYHPIAIDRSKRSQAMEQLIKQGGERLALGRCIVIYPEGTRMPSDKPGRFKIGGAMTACKNNATVIPVAHNAGVFWPKRGFIKTPGTIDLVIGKPIDVTGKTPEDVNKEVDTWVKQTLETLPSSNTAK